MRVFSTLIFRGLRPWLTVLTLAAAPGLSARAQRVLWSEAAALSTAARPAAPALTYYRAVEFQLAAVRDVLGNAPAERAAPAARALAPVISLPLPDGRSQRFRVEQVPVLAPALAARYPALRTYRAQGLDDPTATARLDITPAGFHAQILAPGSTVYIDPAAPGSATHLVFERQAMHRPPFVCAVAAPAEARLADELRPPAARAAAHGATLRTYRLALACTGEYAAFHGGTRAGALAAITTSINRVSGIYERELAVRLVLVANNDALVFLDPDTDPYSNDDGEAMLEENQTTVDQLIGPANYDIGHVFSTGGGGIAQRPAVCIEGKAKGVTGLNQPVGDAFDVDYVAHEMGHQFGADHTFNSQTGACGGGNREPGSAYEPGSGTTIMAYAGICGADNIQPSSDAYFHSRSLDQMVAHITGDGNCAVSTPTGNTPPVVNAGRSYAIPLGTPFVLTGSATDANADALTYVWEQYNRGPAGGPNAPVGDAPLFRSFPPTPSPSRTFPRLANVLSNTQTIGERLPTYGRRLIFRLVARDNRAGGGGTAYDSVQVVAVANTGPFVVTSPNTATTWVADAPQQVSWSVANTTQAPISAATVDLLLSTDGGLTYPTTLLAATPNDGSQTLTLPAGVAATTRARLRVQASGGIFFDVSDQNFTIEVPTGPTFYLQGPGGTAGSLSFCAGSAGGTLALTVGQLQGFSGPVTLTAPNLPAGVTVSFASATVAAGAGTTATISAAAGTAAGSYTLVLTGTSGGTIRTLEVPLTIRPSATQAPALTAPTAGTTTGLRPRLTWSAVANATGYEVQLATNAAFTAGLQTSSNVPGTSFTPLRELLPATTYYGRVRALSACGAGPYSAVVSFLTDAQVCRTFAGASLPQPIPAGTRPILTSVISVTDANRVSNIRIRDLDLTHDELSDLEISLTNPAGRRVVVYPRQCAGSGTLRVSFDDGAAAALTCPVTAGATVRPATSFADLLGAPATGNWTLTIADNNANNGGTFRGWTLELCTLNALPEPPVSLTALAPATKPATAALDLLWVDKADNETGFEVERSSGGSTAFARIATLPANTTFYTDNVTANGQYCYRVRAVNTVGPSAYSNVSCQTVAGITSAGAAALQSAVTVAPNPSSGLFQLTIDTPQRGSMQLRVLDAVGRVVYARTLLKTVGQLQLPLDLRALRSGIYTLHLTTNTGPAIVRLVKE
ncbi:proprotein convertase P-domain-containing protein [Hymenobacter sp. NST-14]|uniref:reprolysin-like metallopeptidase n=1 Tax=Hymenobacter piscis TaxID=2839984 RepID=UPI001C028E45|nr:zinc-dependent metalloprotease family protein [Hymenobacter piscis]MBT9394000.1 proprotein convertase P-domain-containing protein [Hymenobacter piscis]